MGFDRIVTKYFFSQLQKFQAKLLLEERIESSDVIRLQVIIEGMTCAACVNNVEGVLGDEPGIVSVSVNLLTKMGTIDYKPPATESFILESISNVVFFFTNNQNHKSNLPFSKIVELHTNSYELNKTFFTIRKSSTKYNFYPNQRRKTRGI